MIEKVLLLKMKLGEGNYKQQLVRVPGGKEMTEGTQSREEGAREVSPGKALWRCAAGFRAGKRKKTYPGIRRTQVKFTTNW